MATDYTYPAFGYEELVPSYEEKIEEAKKRLARKKTVYDINESAISDFADPNYKPTSILDQFADPDYVPESIQDKIAKEVPMEQQLSISELMLNAKAKDSKQLRESKALSKYAADLNKKDKAAKAKAEKEKFVPRDTLLGRIFDKRIKPGEDISNSAKASAMLRNLSDNLLERRLVGGKEGTDTLSRILGPGGGLAEGLDEIETLKTTAQTKQAAAIDKALEREKKAYEIKKIDSEAMKNIAEVAKSDYTAATQAAMELATVRGFQPGTSDYMAEVDAILSVAVTEGQASIIKDLADLQSQLSIMDPDSDAYKAMQDRINMLQRKSIGSTVDTDAYSLPAMTLNPDGSPRTS